MALDCLRDELGMSLDDLADRTGYEAHDLRVTLTGDTQAPTGHGPAMARAMADVMEHREVLAASA